MVLGYFCRPTIDDGLWTTVWAYPLAMRETGGNAARVGIGFGSALAITISWSLHHSILWAIIHGVFSWFYVIYYALTRQV